jgi:hypothetical protein
MIVSNNPMTVEQEFQLEITTDTLFKSVPVDSTALNKEQKTVLKAGQTFKVLKYGWLDGHLKVLLEESIPPIGSFGYVYTRHVRFRQGKEVLHFDVDRIPNTEINAKLWITQTTLIKKKPADQYHVKIGSIYPTYTRSNFLYSRICLYSRAFSGHSNRAYSWIW